MLAVIEYDDAQDPRAGRDVTITYVGNDRGFAQAYLNVNAFPEAAHASVHAAASRFAMFHYQLKLLHVFLDESKERFVQHIREPKFELANLLSGDTRDRFVAKFDGIEVLTALNGLFYVLKSFFDVYAQLLCSLIAPHQSMSFKRRNIGTTNLSGGTFIRWLRTSCPASFANREGLASFIESESRQWITEAVAHRDTLGHYSDIEDVHALQVPLNRLAHPDDPMYEPASLQSPRMPSGELVEIYALGTGDKLRQFVISTLGMFPELKHHLLRFPAFDINQELWSDK